MQYCDICKLNTLHIDDICDVCKGEAEEDTMPSTDNKAVICPVCDGRGVLVYSTMSVSTDPETMIQTVNPPEGHTKPCHGCGGQGWVEIGKCECKCNDGLESAPVTCSKG